MTNSDDPVVVRSPVATRSPLLPVRHDQDLFIADVFDGYLKGDLASMEFPIFSLSTKPDTEVRRFEFADGHFVEITPSVKGLATVHDRDFLMYCMSQLVAAKNENRPISRTIRFIAHDCLRFSNRETSGSGYAGMKQALERLGGTRISTNIRTGGQETFETFGLIDKAKIVSETRDGRMREIELTLSEWSFRSVEAMQILTYNKQYFQLRSPLERRIYDIARKMCGDKRVFKIGLGKLKDRCGSKSTMKEFRRMVNKIVGNDVDHDHMPDYGVTIDDRDMVTFTSKRPVPEQPKLVEPSFDVGSIRLKPETYDLVREAAPGWDKYHLEQQWRGWMADGADEPPRNPDKAFIGFCRKYYERNGAPN